MLKRGRTERQRKLFQKKRKKKVETRENRKKTLRITLDDDEYELKRGRTEN